MRPQIGNGLHRAYAQRGSGSKGVSPWVVASRKTVALESHSLWVQISALHLSSCADGFCWSTGLPIPKPLFSVSPLSERTQVLSGSQIKPQQPLLGNLPRILFSQRRRPLLRHLLYILQVFNHEFSRICPLLSTYTASSPHQATMFSAYVTTTP